MLISRSVPFRFEVPALTTKGLASLPIQPPFSVNEILNIFPTNTQNKLIYRFFSDTVAKVPTTGEVGGLDLCRDVVDKGEFVGENVAYSVPCHVGFQETAIYLKFQARNDTSGALVAAAVFHIILER